MSDSEDSTVTYTEAPSSPDYVPGPEKPEQAPPLPDFIPKPVYQEFMPQEDEVFSAEEQPMPAAILPTTNSLGYIADSDPEKDPTDYPVDRGDDDVDDDGSSDDDEDDYDDDNDDDDVEEDEEEKDEEEEYPAPSNSILPPPVHRTTARISIPVQAPTPFWFEAEIDRFLAIPSPAPAPLSLCPTNPLGYRAAMIRLIAETPYTSHSPPPNVLPHTMTYVAMLRADAPSTYILAPRSETPPSRTPPLLRIPLPTSSPPLLLPSTSHRVDVPKVTLPPQNRLCIALCLRYEVGESLFAPIARPAGGFRVDYGFVATLDDKIRRDPERDVGYGITDTWDEMLVGMPRAPATNETELG
uniref:Uncharacterized protein n=1 Tax=Tanacetum cinerariifolium TaxID=118510 RepID=A0A699HGU2_TANCI|nr:hypothetical protein [Tanacetum cinerariifolium]